MQGLSVHLRAEEPWERLPPRKPLPKAICNGYAVVNGTQIFYSIYGSGRPLVLLHGGLGNMAYFGNQIPVFAERLRLLLWIAADTAEALSLANLILTF